MTLVELVISIGVLIIISTLCFPKDNLNKHKINSFAKQICSDIRYVRKCNMLGDLSTYIYYKKDEETISYIVRGSGKDIKEIKVPSEIKLEYGQSKILFDTYGVPTPQGQTIKIYDDKIKKEITIVPASGRVLLKEGKYAT